MAWLAVGPLQDVRPCFDQLLHGLLTAVASTQVEESCKPSCVKALLVYQACAERIKADTTGQAHCTGQYVRGEERRALAASRR